jgi:EAL and modified HD-GYP domain-containing signal transduction protein
MIWNKNKEISMYLCKRPIYNTALTCVALEVNAQTGEFNQDDIKNKLATILNTNTENVPVLMPHHLYDVAKNIEVSFPVIMKLSAAEIEKGISLDEIENSTETMALLMDDVEQLSWLNFVDYIGIDGDMLKKNSMKKVVEYIHSQNNKVIAYDIDDLARFQQCKNLNMDFYCGEFLYQPNFDDEDEIAANKMNLINLVSVLQDEDVSLEKITDIINADPALSFQLLKVANSSAFSGVKKIDSIQQAIVRLGFANLKNIVMLLSMRSVSDKPKELLESGLIRAFMCQSLANQLKKQDEQMFYTTGLLSVLDTLMDHSMEKLVEQTNLNQAVKRALISREGDLGSLLSTVASYEDGSWCDLDDFSYEGIDLCQIYLLAMDKASQTIKAMS